MNKLALFAAVSLFLAPVTANAFMMELDGQMQQGVVMQEINSGHSYDAFKLCERIIQADPNDPGAWFWEADVFQLDYLKTRDKSNLDYAYSAIQKSYILDPRFATAPGGPALMEVIVNEEASYN